MDITLAVTLIIWLAGVFGFALHGYHAGLRLGLFHPVPLANILFWPVTFPLCAALFYWRSRTGEIA